MSRSRRGSLSSSSMAPLDSRPQPRRTFSDVSTDTDEDSQSDSSGDDSHSDAGGASLPFEHTIPSKCGGFELLAEVKLEPAFHSPVKVVKWRSKDTGLSVVWADTPGPIVKSWTTVASEIFDDTGRPHTLEHLVFMGSEKYPYKGVLDQLGNRCHSSGANAWTQVDNTTFTISTVGEQAMLQILPVYLDHIFNPTMTQAAFDTEVFNVNGEGHESGVVFAEMQAMANTSDSLLELRMQQVLYDSRNGYRSETGGMLDALRHLKNDHIKRYHSSAYVPQNVTILVCGNIHPLRLLSTLTNTVERDLALRGLAKGPSPPGWRRPFVETSTAQNPPQLPRHEKEVVFYPEKDESVGSVMLHWIGPDSQDYLRRAGLDLLGEYLSGSSIAPLNLQFVEGKDPSASDISFTSDFRNVTILHCIVSSVPSNKLRTVGDDILQAIADLAESSFDLKRMKDVLHQAKLSFLAVLEGATATWVQGNVLADILYGADDGSDLSRALDDLRRFEELGKWTSQQWTSLLHEWFVARPSLTLIGKPSKSLAEKKGAEDAARVAATRQQLGSDGLAAHAERLRVAQAKNAKPVPRQLLKSFEIPSLNHLEWIQTESALARGISQKADRRRFRNSAQDYVNRDGPVPLFIQFDHFPSHFVEIAVYLQSTNTHPLLDLFLSSFFSLPVTRADGRTFSHEQVALALSRDFIWSSIRTVAEGVVISAKVEAEKYETAISWLGDLLTGSVFDAERLVNTVIKSLQDMPSAREDDAGVASAGHQLLFLSEQSVLTPLNLLNLLKTTPKLLRRLRSEPQSVVKELRELRHDLTDPRAMRTSVQGDILALRNPSSAWSRHFLHLVPFDKSELVSVKRQIDAVSSLGRRPSRKMDIYRSPSSESTYSRHMASSISSQHRDYPALRVAVAALNAAEGYIWNAVRGPGLAYGANLSLSDQTRSITLVIYRSPDAFAAFKAARQLIESLVSGQIPLTQESVDAAKSSIAFHVVSNVSSPSDVADTAFFNEVIYDLPRDLGRQLLSDVQDVTIQDLLPVIHKYISPIFDPTSSIGVVSCGAGQLEQISKSFRSAGFDVEEKAV